MIVNTTKEIIILEKKENHKEKKIKSIHIIFVLCIIITGFFSIQNRLESAETKKFLVLGKWQATSKHIIYHDKVGSTYGETKLILDIYKQDGDFLWARIKWKVEDDSQGKHDTTGKPILGGIEELIGMYTFDSRNIVFLVTHDNGRLDLKIIDKNTMNLNYTEQGHNEAVVSRAIFKRTVK
ncbi:MAG: hypothetical protein GY710_20465 [Desulfobacteraceae bacterium]|nr:hypothetical protein [Desulfobacteraceae bacterium]